MRRGCKRGMPSRKIVAFSHGCRDGLVDQARLFSRYRPKINSCSREQVTYNMSILHHERRVLGNHLGEGRVRW